MKSFIKESKKIIRKAMNNNKLVIFVGSGVSLNSGYPSWGDLINEFKKGIDIDNSELTTDDYLKIPQYYYNERNKKEYYELINEVFDVKAKPNVIHDLILQFNPNNIITTNYDKLIEEAAAEKGMFYDVVSRDKDLPYTENNNMIIKMHGDFTYNNIVLKEEDYLSYSSNFKLIENYIKSLLSSNVILFVGYSINDINMKIIFQWVKDILKKDFQPAYFINVDEDYNHIQFDYYKNRGINILYYDEGESLDDFPNESCNLSSSKGEKLYNFLLFLLNDKQIYDLDFYYERLVNLDYLNKVRIKDIRKALEITNEVKERENNLLFHNSNKFDYLIKKFNEWQNKKIEDNDEIRKLNLIKRVFKKANIEKIKKEGKVVYEFSNDKDINSLSKLVLNYNYCLIKNKINKGRKENVIEGNEYELISKAYSLYHIGNYYKAYEILKSVSKIAFKNKKHIIYFISEFNREHIGSIVSKFYEWFDITKEVASDIKEEIGKINLDELFLKLPDDEKQSLSFIKEIMNFKFVYINSNEVTKLGEEVRKEKDTIYVGEGKKKGKIHKLQKKVYKFWNFISGNRLMIDNYTEIKKYFYRFIESTLFSYSFVKEKIKKETIFGLDIKGKTMKLKNIDYFTLFIMTKYLKRKELKYLLKEYSVNELKIKEEDLEKAIQAFENIIDSFLILENKRDISNEFNKFLYVLSYVNVGEEYFINIIDCIKVLLKNRNIRTENYRNISSFIIGQNDKFNDNINVEKLDELLYELIFLEIKNEDNEDIFFGVNIIRTLTNIINYTDEEFISNSNKLVPVLIDGIYNLVDEKNQKCINYLIKTIIPMFKICDENIKKEIKKLVKSLLDKSFNFSLYYESVRNKIIKSNENYEINAAQIIKKRIDKEKNSDVKKYPDTVKDFLIKVGNLYLNDELVSPDIFYKFKGENDIFDFFINIDNYDYNKFKVDWVEEITISLHKKISKNEKAKEIIKKKLKDKIINEPVDKELKELFFEYYD